MTSQFSINTSKSEHETTRDAGQPVKRQDTIFAQSRFMRKDRDNVLLQKLNNRHLRTIDGITPEIASETVRRYILPMLVENNRTINSKSRASQYGFDRDPTEYEKVTLSDALTADLNITKDELTVLRNQLFQTVQDTEDIQYELQKQKKELIQSETQILMLTNEAKQHYDEIRNTTEEYTEQTKAMQAQRQQFNKEYFQKQKVAGEIQHETSMNQRYKITATGLDYSNSLLHMENDIMGENLKGLYESVTQITNPEYLNGLHKQQLDYVQGLTKILGKLLNSRYEKFSKLSKICDDSSERNHRDAKQVERWIKDTSKTRSRLHNSSQKLNLEIQQTTETKTDLDEGYTKLTKRSKDLIDLVNKLRARTAKFKPKDSDLEEKQCKNCGKAFIEKENFNWSCWTHATPQYGGTMWWCCGKTSENAKGWVMQKHVPREDEDDAQEKQKEKQAMKKLNADKAKCHSCKFIGHFTHLCSKDPNIRSSSRSILDEQLRISALSNRNESKRGNHFLETRDIVLYETEVGEKLDIPWEVENFEDVHGIKEDTPFKKQDTLVHIADVKGPKDLEREDAVFQRENSRKLTMNPMNFMNNPMNLMAIPTNLALRQPYKIVLSGVDNDEMTVNPRPNLQVLSIESQGDEDVDATRIGD